MSEWHKEFVVASISREDFREISFTQERIARLTDEEIKEIARKMGDLYAENGYWIDLELAATFVLAQIQEKRMKILSHEAVKALPALYSQEDVDDPIVTVRLYHPYSDWFWYPTEWNEEQGLFFGYVRGFEGELGYFSVAEFKEVEDSTGVSFVVDETFTPMPLSQVKLLPNRQLPGNDGIIIYIA